MPLCAFLQPIFILLLHACFPTACSFLTVLTSPKASVHCLSISEVGPAEETRALGKQMSVSQSSKTSRCMENGGGFITMFTRTCSIYLPHFISLISVFALSPSNRRLSKLHPPPQKSRIRLPSIRSPRPARCILPSLSVQSHMASSSNREAPRTVLSSIRPS